MICHFAVHGLKHGISPNKTYLYITQSPMNDQIGWLKVAGLFFSKKKWPTQANPYPNNIPINMNTNNPVCKAKIILTSDNDVPTKCKLLLVKFLCSLK